MTANESNDIVIYIEFINCPRCKYEFCQHSEKLTHEYEDWYCGYCGYSVEKRLADRGTALQEKNARGEASNSQTGNGELSYRWDICESFGAFGVVWDRGTHNDIRSQRAAIENLLKTLHLCGAESLYHLFGGESFAGKQGVLTRKLSDQELVNIDEKLRESGCIGHVTVWDEKTGTARVVVGDFETFFSILDGAAVTGPNPCH